MVKNYLLPSCHKLCCARPYQYVLPHPVANPHSRSVAPNRPPSSADFSRCSERDLFFWVKLCTRYSMVHILPTSSSKSVLNASFFFNISKCKLSSRYCPVHFLSTTFPHRGPHPQKQRPYFGDPRNQFTRKKHRVSRTRVFSPLNSRVPELLLFSICCFHTRTALGSCLMMT